MGNDYLRKIVEHITLVKAKEGLSDEEEKDMLDYIYTSQYQMGGIVAISLGELWLSWYYIEHTYGYRYLNKRIIGSLHFIVIVEFFIFYYLTSFIS